MKKQGKVCLMVGLTVLLILSAVAQAEVYVEGFLGGTTASGLGSSSFHQTDLPQQDGTLPFPDSSLKVNNNAAVAPSIIGGGRVGYWFVPNGALGLNYPPWMKYFGVYTDVSYQNLNVNEQSVSVADYNDFGVFQGNFPGKFYSRGYVVTWAFMFAARYGFLPDDKVPFGRLQPWVAVGPAILFTGMKPKATIYAGPIIGAVANPGWQSAVVPALVVDAGIRYMIFKNLSIDVSFRYRYAQPNFNFSFTDINGFPSHLNFSPTYNLFSGMAGIAYHF